MYANNNSGLFCDCLFVLFHLDLPFSNTLYFLQRVCQDLEMIVFLVCYHTVILYNVWLVNDNIINYYHKNLVAWVHQQSFTAISSLFYLTYKSAPSVSSSLIALFWSLFQAVNLILGLRCGEKPFSRSSWQQVCCLEILGDKAPRKCYILLGISEK